MQFGRSRGGEAGHQAVSGWPFLLSILHPEHAHRPQDLCTVNGHAPTERLAAHAIVVYYLRLSPQKYCRFLSELFGFFVRSVERASYL